MRRLGGLLFAMLLAFFAGVIATLVVLAPGDRQVGDILKSRDVQHWADFDQAGDRVENLGDKALVFASETKDCIRRLFAQE